MRPVNLLEKGDTALDHDGASIEIKVPDVIHVLHLDDHRILIRALRIVPHVSLGGSTDEEIPRGGILDKVLDVFDAVGVLYLGDIVASWVAFTIKGVPLQSLALVSQRG